MRAVEMLLLYDLSYGSLMIVSVEPVGLRALEWNKNEMKVK